ncbi:hypothetical protein [Geomesophilobacter sediminis]|uniref:Uncharacterized protein n=1 Tax=Geomesophilobacter sediminis TaxID=2798584 RepID=A0A8J7JI35_9BACT|nr:hypothetical protein [Geomesophilobacter sediminis]MBJ6724125.1 hypothetical protein [Geomesophilobacter sediminis]
MAQRKMLTNGSRGPIPATVMLQILEEGRGNRSAEILTKVARGEMTPFVGFCLLHPTLVISVCMIVSFVVYALSTLVL